jgi:hypothetical protein
MSKAKVVQVIDQKINTSDSDAKTLEKNYCKGSGGQAACRDFLEEYVKKRKDFHKYQILKVKVNMS